MNHLDLPDTIVLVWLAAFNALAFLAFGFDKWRAGRLGQRIPESQLVLLGALGGWPGGFLGMNVFRHKTVKWTFQLKYALALLPFAAEIAVWLHFRHTL